MFDKRKNQIYVMFNNNATQRIVNDLSDVILFEGENRYFTFEQFSDDGKILVRAFSEIYDFAVNYIKLFQNELFSDISLKYLHTNLPQIIDDKRFHIKYNDYISYGADDKYKLYMQKKQDSTVKFSNKTKYKINVDFNLREYGYGNFCYGTLIDNNIVSVARCDQNIYSCSECEVVQISVDTNENYRKQGYAVSNVVSITEYLLSGEQEVKNIKEVIYITDFNNIYSQKTALSAGFIEISKGVAFSFKPHIL